MLFMAHWSDKVLLTLLLPLTLSNKADSSSFFCCNSICKRLCFIISFITSSRVGVAIAWAADADDIIGRLAAAACIIGRLTGGGIDRGRLTGGADAAAPVGAGLGYCCCWVLGFLVFLSVFCVLAVFCEMVQDLVMVTLFVARVGIFQTQFQD